MISPKGVGELRRLFLTQAGISDGVHDLLEFLVGQVARVGEAWFG